MKAIQNRRSRIDRIDDELVRLLNRRAKLAIEIGAFKRRHGLSAISAAREREILLRASRANSGPLGRKAIGRVFRTILEESRRAARVPASSDARRAAR
jgi:chorismate mutase